MRRHAADVRNSSDLIEHGWVEQTYIPCLPMNFSFVHGMLAPAFGITTSRLYKRKVIAHISYLRLEVY